MEKSPNDPDKYIFSSYNRACGNVGTKIMYRSRLVGNIGISRAISNVTGNVPINRAC